MFQLIWSFAFIINGVPHIEKLVTEGKMDKGSCVSIIAESSDRMGDWMRGVLRQDLSFPLGVKGDCEPVEKDS